MVIKIRRIHSYNIKENRKKSFLHKLINDIEKWRWQVVYSNFIQTKSYFQE